MSPGKKPTRTAVTGNLLQACASGSGRVVFVLGAVEVVGLVMELMVDIGFDEVDDVGEEDEEDVAGAFD